MSYARIWTHVVFATKDRYPFLKKEIREKIREHIFENALTKNINLIRVNGHEDHLHCLLSLNNDLSIAKTVQLIKGESAFWINKNNLTRSKFEWGVDYYAASVSDADLDRVKKYIDGQEEHHAKKVFAQEFQKFIDSLAPMIGIKVPLKSVRGV